MSNKPAPTDNFQQFAFSDEVRLKTIWSDLEELSLAFGKRNDHLPDLYVFSSGLKIEFPRSLSQADRRAILEPMNWQFRQWWAQETYGLDLSSTSLTSNQSQTVFSKMFFNLLPDDQSQKIPLAEQFRIAENTFATGQKKQKLWKISHQLPFCLITFPDRSNLIGWRFDPQLIYPGDFATQKQLLVFYEQLSQKLLLASSDWEDYFHDCCRRWHKPRLNVKNFARAWAPLVFRDGENLWREQLIKSNLRPTAYAYALNYATWGEKNPHFLLELTTFNYNYLSPLTKTAQLLAWDDQKLTAAQAVKTEFRMMNHSDYLNPVQLEIYLNLLADRQELSEQWLWPT